MQHRTQYWLSCPGCGHQMKVSNEEGPLSATSCDNCGLLFSFTIEELALAESVGKEQQ